MHTFQNILVGITFDSELHGPTRASERAALQARRLAEHGGTHVTLLYAHVDPHPVTGGALLGGHGSADVSLAVQPLLETFRAAGISCAFVEDDERPWLALIRRVQQEDVDLVVVAARDRARAGTARFGTNTRKLLRKCPCPVWVVHPTHELLRRSVLAASDLTEVGQRATRLAADVARGWDAELHVVHALGLASRKRLDRGLETKQSFVERVTSKEAEARAEIVAGLGEAAPVDPHVHVGPGPPMDVILASVDEVDPDLLVMGTLSRSGVPGLLLGNTAEKLLDRLDCSLLAVKPEGFRSPVEA